MAASRTSAAGSTACARCRAGTRCTKRSTASSARSRERASSPAKQSQGMRIEIMSWEQAEPQAAPIRFAIFVEEKQAAGFELDDLDKDCVHAMAYDDAGKAIGTARMQPDGQIGRMAVVKDWRRRGAGAA